MLMFWQLLSCTTLNMLTPVVALAFSQVLFKHRTASMSTYCTYAYVEVLTIQAIPTPPGLGYIAAGAAAST